MAARGWGGPSIREGSHPPPYMTISQDLKECQDLLDWVDTILRTNYSYEKKVRMIRARIAKRPRRAK
jgi:hypothetical protein